jgi:hypothetical protein
MPAWERDAEKQDLGSILMVDVEGLAGRGEN